MPSPVVSNQNVVPPRQPQAKAPSPAAGSRNEMLIDELDLKISDEDKETISKVETKVTYWTFAAEALRQVSLVPGFLARHANGTLAFLELHRWGKLATYFELAERGSKWLYLDPAHLKALGEAASHLTRLESTFLGVARSVGKVLPWAAPAFATWDVCRAMWEHDPARRTAAIGNAWISVFAGLTSFAFPGFSMLLVGVQMVDAVKGQRLARMIGRVFQRDWAETRAHQVQA
jgi:hypothetical protein